MCDQEEHNWPTPSKEHLLEVAALADDLERETPAWPTVEKLPGGVSVGPPNDGPTLSKLHRLVDEVDLVVPFDWAAWADEGMRLVEDPEALAEADLVTIQKLITAHFRQERFCDGHLASIHESGHLVAILRRIGQIAAEMQ